MIDWTDPKVIAAIETYVRLAVGAVFVIIVLYLFATNNIDIAAVLKAFATMMALDRIGIGAIGLRRDIQNRE